MLRQYLISLLRIVELSMSNPTGGKGSKPRPIPNPEQFRSNWDQVFKKKEEKNDKEKL
jgi:hypothetical protein